MIRQKMDSLSFELLSRMAHMMTRMTRMTHWLDSHDSLARWLTVCQDPTFCPKTWYLFCVLSFEKRLHDVALCISLPT